MLSSPKHERCELLPSHCPGPIKNRFNTNGTSNLPVMLFDSSSGSSWAGFLNFLENIGICLLGSEIPVCKFHLAKPENLFGEMRSSSAFTESADEFITVKFMKTLIAKISTFTNPASYTLPTSLHRLI